MTDEELEIFEDLVKDLEENKLQERERLIFILGVQGGLHSDDNRVMNLLNRVADYCLDYENEYKMLNDVKDFDN